MVTGTVGPNPDPTTAYLIESACPAGSTAISAEYGLSGTTQNVFGMAVTDFYFTPGQTGAGVGYNRLVTGGGTATIFVQAICVP